MTERGADHSHFRPSHTSHWFASTQPIRLPALSDFASWIWPDTVRVVPKASNTAEHTQQICSWTRPSLPKRFRCPTFGLVCSWLKSGVVHIPVPVSEKSLHHCLKLNILMRTQVYAPVHYFMGIANYHTWQATCVTSCTFCITGIVALPGISSYTKFRCWNRYEKGKKRNVSAHLYLSLQLINVVQHEHSLSWKDLETQNVTYSCVSVLCPLLSSIQTNSPPCTSPKRFPNL